jgi:hypothetical protein
LKILSSSRNPVSSSDGRAMHNLMVNWNDSCFASTRSLPDNMRLRIDHALPPIRSPLCDKFLQDIDSFLPATVMIMDDQMFVVRRSEFLIDIDFAVLAVTHDIILVTG